MATIELTKENFESTISENTYVIIDFWASWCGPCQSFSPIYEQVSVKHPDIVFAKVNTEKEQELASFFQIRSIPTLMMSKEQVFVFQQAGALPESGLEELIQKVIELDMEQVRADLENSEKDES